MKIPFVLLFIYFIAAWYGALWLTAKAGWSKLAAKYRSNNLATDSWKGWLWGRIGLVSYKGCLWVSADSRGLYMKTGPLFFFRTFHDPLFIPWSAIQKVEESNYFWVKVFAIKFKDVDVQLKLEPRALSDATKYLGDKLVTTESGKSSL
jgi:hypothetical protein